MKRMFSLLLIIVMLAFAGVPAWATNSPSPPGDSFPIPVEFGETEFAPASVQSSTPLTIPGYVIQVDFNSGDAKRAGLIPLRSFEDVEFIVKLGRIDVSALIEITTQIGLGIGVGKSGNMTRDGALRWNVGLSWLDDFKTAWKPRTGVYFGVTWTPI